jgi:hypothetical protein
VAHFISPRYLLWPIEPEISGLEKKTQKGRKLETVGFSANPTIMM